MQNLISDQQVILEFLKSNYKVDPEEAGALVAMFGSLVEERTQ